MVATALLDRLPRHAVVVRIEGTSYRLRRVYPIFGMKLFFRWARLNRSPVPGWRSRADPRFGPLAIPLRRAWLASGRLCRRPSGGRMFEDAVLHLLWADNSAGLARHVKRWP